MSIKLNGEGAYTGEIEQEGGAPQQEHLHPSVQPSLQMLNLRIWRKVTKEQKAAITKKLCQRSWTSSSSQRAAHDQQAEQLMQDKGSGGTQVMG